MKRFCVIGYPVRHSLSPKIHNKWFRQKGIAARYGKEEVLPEELGDFMAGFSERFSGANVTIPHKETVMKFLDVISPEAKKIGAVNTIVVRRGSRGRAGASKLFGYNTDCDGAMSALKSALKKGESLRGKRAVVLGAGGAARAIVYGLKKAGAKVLILNRTLSHAKKLAVEFGCSAGAPAVPACRGTPRKSAEFDTAKFPMAEFDIIINATSVGMKKKNETPLPELYEFVRKSNGKNAKRVIVMDLVYVPRMTRLLSDAKKAGCRIVLGERMLLAQAAKSFELWTGEVPIS